MDEASDENRPETLHEGRYLRLCRRGRWEYAERANATSAVIIAALTPGGDVLFVEQFRVAVQSRSIEMPAGLVGDVDGADDMLRAAHRELVEETGYAADRIEMLMSGPSSSGMSNEIIGFVRAHGLRRVGPGGGDGSEDITVHEVPLAAAPAWLEDRRRQGYSVDPKLYAGLYFLSRNPDGSAAVFDSA